MAQREKTLLCFVRKLQAATQTHGLDVMIKVAKKVEQIFASYPLPKFICQDLAEWAVRDTEACRLYPDDAPRDLVPIECNGEGNLLFAAVSQVLVGDESLSLELQIRTVVEMVLWKRYYLSEMEDSKLMLQGVCFSLCTEESKDTLNLSEKNLEDMFDIDVKASCFPGSYANLWHLYALSSVLQFNICSIYPMFNLEIRPYFNRVICPRACPKDFEPQTIHIMWSGQLKSGSFFWFQHFVALVQSLDAGFGSLESVSAIRSEELNQYLVLPNLIPGDENNLMERNLHSWRRQTDELYQKSVTRFEAKKFLLNSYRNGEQISLNQFKKLFPEVSRSSYYNWKQEAIKAEENCSTSTSTLTGKKSSSGDGPEQEVGLSHVAKLDEVGQHNVISMLDLNFDMLDAEQLQNVPYMQFAKSKLQSSIRNGFLPFKFFKRIFPGISRSTYYNWRREVLLSGRNCDTGEGNTSAVLQNNRPVVPRMRIKRRRRTRKTPAIMTEETLSRAAKKWLLKTKRSLVKYKIKFPSSSSCFYWLWLWHGRNEKGFTRSSKVNILKTPKHKRTEKKTLEYEVESENIENPNYQESSAMPSDYPHPQNTLSGKACVDERLFPSGAGQAPADERLFPSGAGQAPADERLFPSGAGQAPADERLFPSGAGQAPADERLFPSGAGQAPADERLFPSGAGQAPADERLFPTGAAQAPADERLFPTGAAQAPADERLFPTGAAQAPADERLFPTGAAQAPADERLFPTGAAQAPADERLFPTGAAQAPADERLFPTGAAQAPADERLFLINAVQALGDEQMFQNAVVLADTKVRAKLFLQKRYKHNDFPSFKEFKAYFPTTSRSTYYMWKRALQHGVSLVN